MERFWWYVKQLVPLTYRTEYRENGEKHFCVWKMWMGRSYHIDDVVVEAVFVQPVKLKPQAYDG